MAMKNLDKWQAKADRIKHRQEHPEVEYTKSDEDSEATGVMDELEEKVSKIKIRQESSSAADVVHEAVSWEEDEEELTDSLLSIEKTRSGIWKNIGGERWIDESVRASGSRSPSFSYKRIKEEDEEDDDE